FGRPGAHKDLRSAEVRSEYRKAAKAAGQEIASLAMGVLNGVPLATEAEAERWVGECIEVCPEMGVKVVLLAFFDKGDILDRPDLQPRLVERLKRLAPGAEKARVVLGLETYLSADDHIRILDAVGSPAVQVYYDVANMTTKGYDIHKEIRRLGRERICEFHMKENGFLLGKGKVDFARVKAAIDEIGYRGWLIIEGATVAGRSVVDCYRENQKYLRSVFPTSRKKESA
ncbi:MAG: sugar phosphate isomerase/epimerase, partial [Planctomycetes bacterium]|nr:sugar phosphate isomerase/epimerase [Planctomycetota bacterium]